MKSKLFIQLYGSYFLVLIIILLFLSKIIYIPFLVFYYTILLREYNRVGFINAKIKYLLILLIFFTIMEYKSYIFYLGIVLTIICLSLHIPHRKKVNDILKVIKYKQAIKVFNNRVEYEGTTYNFGFELKEREIFWLSKQILFKSKTLTHMDIEFINNEFLGNHFYVNIR